MIIQAQNYRYKIDKRRRVTHETFTRRYALANLESKLESAKRDLGQLPANQRRRQREKISRLELQIDAQRLLIESES